MDAHTRKKKRARLGGIGPAESNTEEDEDAIISEESLSSNTRMIPRRVSCDDCVIQESTRQGNGADTVETTDSVTDRFSPISRWWAEHDDTSIPDATQSRKQLPKEIAPQSLETDETDLVSLDDSAKSQKEANEELVETTFDVIESTKHRIRNLSGENEQLQLKPSSKRRRMWSWIGMAVLALGVVLKSKVQACYRPFAMPHFTTQQETVEKDAVCVSGGGFSGFWYIIGRLQSIPDPLQKNYYCYSAGCLGLVASFLDIAMEDVHKMAVDIQRRWNNGEISRYEVLTMFVDDLIGYRYNNTISGFRPNDLEFLDRLNILTTVRDGWLGLKTSTRTPTNIQSLRTLLVQSAWIPFATGNGLFYRGHMDGAFFLAGHPRCETTFGLPADIDIVANIVNVNLSAKKVQQFWKLGSQRGF